MSDSYLNAIGGAGKGYESQTEPTVILMGD